MASKSIAQLDFERRALLAVLDHSRPTEANACALIRQIEEVDLAMAATPAASIEDLAVKIDRMVDLLAIEVTDLADTLESLFVAAVQKDSNALASCVGKPK